ncbi:MAG: hypothetical protein EOP86_05855, partial [Verrucomicrobiaceae bacterium]
MASLSRFLSGTLSLLLLAAPARAQFEIKGGASNVLDPRRAGASATVSSEGGVESITVRAGGSGYTAPPAVVVAPPPSGVTATATAEIAGGRVTIIHFTEGSGYSSASPPAVYIAPPVVPTGAPASTPQFAGVANTSATAGAISDAEVDAPDTGRFPRARDTTVPTAPVITVVLGRASFGHSFASGVPLYFMGDEIQRPLVRWDGATTPAGQNYWRSKPVQPGETFASAYTDNLDGKPDPTKPIIAQAKVSVKESSTASSSVQVASVPPTLTTGAMLLGQRVNFISGTTVTLAGNANETIASTNGVEKSFSAYQPSYYSPHADRVFASQPGRVTITWVSAAPDTSLSGESKATFKFRRETFAVSSASRRPAKVIYWTEKGFDGPLVPVPTGRIVRVNPVFNSFVPGMATEYVPVGSNPNPTPGVTPAAEPRTLWFDNQNGPAALHAYNVEGRLLIEYLGSEKQGASGVHNFLGADIVDIKRVAEVATIETKLGERIRPRQEAAQNGDDQLIPSILLNTAQSTLYYGSFIRPDNVSDYYAERENLDPDRIIMYWLDPSDAAIHFLTAPSAPGLSINWPKYKRKYTQIWPAALADYQPVNVPNAGSSAATGPKFAATNLPQLVFQDDPTQKEASVDAQTQRLIVNLSSSADKTNRSLLKFNSSTGPWYVRLYIQSEERLGSPEVPDPDGNGPLNGAPAVYTINDMNADGIADWSANGLAQGSEADPLGGVTKAVVGARLEPPSGAYELGGYVAKGRCYSATAYKDPFTDGVDAAAAGGIIPVNALSTDNELTVWWFRKVQAPGTQFESFHVPAIAARYKV